MASLHLLSQGLESKCIWRRHWMAHIEFGANKSLFTLTILLFAIVFILGHWGLKQCTLLFHCPLSSFPTTVHLVCMSPCYTLNNDGNFDSQKLFVSPSVFIWVCRNQSVLCRVHVLCLVGYLMKQLVIIVCYSSVEFRVYCRFMYW